MGKVVRLMFWLGLVVGVIGTVLLEFLYCALTLSNYEDDE